jgi:hypothetical protein
LFGSKKESEMGKPHGANTKTIGEELKSKLDAGQRDSRTSRYFMIMAILQNLRYVNLQYTWGDAMIPMPHSPLFASR